MSQGITTPSVKHQASDWIPLDLIGSIVMLILMHGNGCGTDFQASQCILMGPCRCHWRLTLSLAVWCGYSFRQGTCNSRWKLGYILVFFFQSSPQKIEIRLSLRVMVVLYVCGGVWLRWGLQGGFTDKTYCLSFLNRLNLWNTKDILKVSY